MAISETKRYSRQGLWSLFLICALPLHLWTLILAFRDFSWVAERTNAWDAMGVLSYGLVFAFLESLVVFAAVALLGYLLPRRWQEGRRLALLSVIVLLTALWAMLGQLFFLLELSLPGAFTRFLAQSEHPLRWLYAASLALVVPTVLLPVYLVLRSDRALRFVRELTERLSLLASIYLALDVAGLVVILIRNM